MINTVNADFDVVLFYSNVMFSYVTTSLVCFSVHGRLGDDIYRGNIPNVWASMGLAA